MCLSLAGGDGRGKKRGRGREPRGRGGSAAASAPGGAELAAGERRKAEPEGEEANPQQPAGSRRGRR